MRRSAAAVRCWFARLQDTPAAWTAVNTLPGWTAPSSARTVLFWHRGLGQSYCSPAGGRHHGACVAARCLPAREQSRDSRERLVAPAGGGLSSVLQERMLAMQRQYDSLSAELNAEVRGPPGERRESCRCADSIVGRACRLRQTWHARWPSTRSWRDSIPPWRRSSSSGNCSRRVRAGAPTHLELPLTHARWQDVAALDEMVEQAADDEEMRRLALEARRPEQPGTHRPKALTPTPHSRSATPWRQACRRRWRPWL